MTADKRVLIIGLVAMLVFLSIGVVSAQLFTGSACDAIVPTSAEAGAAGESLDSVLGSAADQGDGDAGDVADAEGVEAAEQLTEDLQGLVDDLSGGFGPLIGVADVSGAASLAGDGQVAGGVADGSPALAALGARTTLLSADGSAARASAQFEDPALVVGDGAGLFALALINQLTGQVDAFAPLDRDLQGGTCLDTAVVGEPFAFHLDAGGGQLLLFRLEENADDPEFELRDGPQGRVWIAPISVPVAPPGILAERVTALLGGDRIVGARRVIPGEAEPAVFALNRGDGTPLWDLEIADIEAVDDRPAWIEVVAVGDELALLGVAPDDDRSSASVVALDASDGSVLWWDETGEAAGELLQVAVGADVVWLALRGDTDIELVALDRADGSVLARADAPGSYQALASSGDGQVVSVGTEAILWLAGDGSTEVVAQLPDGFDGRDVIVAPDGAVTVLVETDEGARGFALTFAGAP